MKEIVDEINNSNTIARILEVGAGVPIANEFFNYAGASKTIFSSESYYSRDAFEKQFGKSDFRAVSAEKLKSINENLFVIDDMEKGLYNTVVSTTFQVGDITNKTSTHGWICINIKDESVRYYHVSLHHSNSRIQHIKNIGEIGILLLHAKNKSIPHNCSVDIVLDENLNPLYETTLQFLSHCEINDMMAVFTSNGIDRLESITRDTENLIVYKGSFNPPSITHKEIMKTSISLYEGNTKGVFCLSYNTFQKGIQSVESFLDRIKFLNKIGWDVIVSTKPLFKDTYDFIRLKYSSKIVFPQGIDTINRMGKDYIYYLDKACTKPTFIEERFKNDFKNVDFLIFFREGEEINPVLKTSLIDTELIKMINDANHNKEISSTMIRNYINQGEFEKIKDFIPEEIYEELITKKF